MFLGIQDIRSESVESHVEGFRTLPFPLTPHVDGVVEDVVGDIDGDGGQFMFIISSTFPLEDSYVGGLTVKGIPGGHELANASHGEGVSYLFVVGNDGSLVA